MPLVSVDCAAESVAKLVFEEKTKVVEELKRNEAEFVAGLTPMQVELMDTNFVAKCQRHIDQLYSSALIKNETTLQIQMHIQWNMGRRIQVWMLSVVLRNRNKGGNKAVRIKLWIRAIASTFKNRGTFFTASSIYSYLFFFLSRFRANVNKGQKSYFCCAPSLSLTLPPSSITYMQVAPGKSSLPETTRILWNGKWWE